MTEPTTIAGIPVVSFEEHLAGLDWLQGEHVAIVGPTGQGKTTLALRLLERRKWVVILATKPKDDTLKGLRGYSVIRKWPAPRPDVRRLILWPKWSSPQDDSSQKRVFHHALMAIFKAGSWCVFADDTQYLGEHMGLRRDLNAMWLNARSIGVSLMAATQRPVWVPREMWANSTHLYIFGTRNGDDLRSLGSLAGLDAKEARAVVGSLPKYHALYINLREPERTVITKVGT